MSRKLMSLGVLAAAFTFVLGATDAEARHSHRHNRCCQNNNYSNSYYSNNCQSNGYYGNGYYGSQQVANYACQPVSVVTTNTCAPRATCCATQQSACATSVVPSNFSAPAPQPFVEHGAPAPSPTN